MKTEISGDSLKRYFAENKAQIDFSRVSLFICRTDGVMLHAFSQQGSSSVSAIGALLAGVWQAAQALSEFIPNRREELDFRLGFDSSAEGVYLLPVQAGEHRLYLAAIYHGMINPGHLKNQLRQMCDGLSICLEQNLIKQQIQGNKYLFDTISNDEMDKLFSFVGGN